MPNADFLYLAVPGTPETKNLISSKRLDMLKSTCGIINIGREKLGYIGPTPLILSSTLKENLLYGNSLKIDN